MPRRRTIVIGAVVGSLVLGGGGAGTAIALSSDGGPTPSRAATDRPCAREYVQLLPAVTQFKDRRFLDEVGAVPEPTTLAFDPEAPDRGIIGSRTGELRVVDDGEIQPAVVLDLTDDTIDSGDGGLLAVAYDPAAPWLYVYRTTVQQDEELLAFPLDADRLPEGDGARLILAVDHPPSEQHHGGSMGFGPDGDLYLGLGDGGGLGDPRENAQDLAEILGKVLRIEPTPDGDDPYVVPPDNPFVGRRGARPEIWALGVRNPFRLTFAPGTGDLWVGDVGQSCTEELDRLPAGQGGLNLGWDVREGTVEFEGGALTGGESLQPMQTYAHRHGWCAIVLGFVTADGGVVHTDYCKGKLMEFFPGDADGPPRLVDLGIRVPRPTAVVADPDGAIWVLSLEGEVYRVVD